MAVQTKMSAKKYLQPQQSLKNKMATSREVCDRIIWDKRLNINAFVIGYQERLSSGMSEKPLAQWSKGGDIPWHRICYIRCQDTIVWDRDQHLDLISTLTLPDAAWKTNTLGNTLSSLNAVRPVYQSAVVIIPPDELLPEIQAIRQCYDTRFYRWMPHINLIYGFIPESHFTDAVEIITPSLAQLQPFTVSLAGFDTFKHSKSSTAWLRPVAQPETALHELQTELQSLFPQCDEQSAKSASGFTPHLSVGQFSSPQDAFTKLPQWHPVNFTVDSIALISRRGNEPFEVRYIIHLGGDEVSYPKG